LESEVHLAILGGLSVRPTGVGGMES
jgi:hypothetical protein